MVFLNLQRRCKTVIIGIALLFLTACTTTPQGKSLDRSNYADLASTAVALTVNSNAYEANPLGYALIPLKLSMGWAVERVYEDCHNRADFVGMANTVFYGLSANNLAVAAGAVLPWSLLIGGAVGYWYYWHGYHLEPDDVWECEQ